MDMDVLIPIFGILLVMIPVAGITLGLTLRLAVKPFVETLATALRESGYAPATHQMSAQLERLHEEFETLTHQVRELKTGQEFDQSLLADRGDVETPER